MIRVIEIELRDAGNVGRHRHMVVGHPLGRPYAADLVRPLAKHLEHPHLFRVGDREALAGIGVAEFLDQIAHIPDSLARRGAVLQGERLKLFDIEHAVGIHELLAAADRGLAHAQLLLVEAGVGGVDEIEGLAALGHGAFELHLVGAAGEIGMHPALIHVGRRIVAQIRAFHDIYPCAVVAVAGMAGDHRTVGRGLAAHHQARAAARLGAGVGRGKLSLRGQPARAEEREQ